MSEQNQTLTRYVVCGPDLLDNRFICLFQRENPTDEEDEDYYDWGDLEQAVFFQDVEIASNVAHQHGAFLWPVNIYLTHPLEATYKLESQVEKIGREVMPPITDFSLLKNFEAHISGKEELKNIRMSMDLKHLGTTHKPKKQEH